MKPINWERVDPEMVQAIQALNKLPGIATVDSCFGHPGKMCNHHSYCFIGVKPTDEDGSGFAQFFSYLFTECLGKIECEYEHESWFQFGLIAYMDEMLIGRTAQPDYRIQISPRHDPGIHEQGKVEKLEGLKILVQLVEEYLDRTDLHNALAAAQ